MRDPFTQPGATILRAVDGGDLVEALVSVPVRFGAAVVRVVVAHDDDWIGRAQTAAIVTVEAVRVRLLAQLEGDRE